MEARRAGWARPLAAPAHTREDAMTIGRICQREVDIADSKEVARAAARRMATRCVGTLVVLDASKHPVGILTDRDLAVRVLAEGLNPDTTPVADVMTRHPATVNEHSPIEDVLALMRSKSVRRMPVVDKQGRLVGLVSVDDVLALLAEEFRHLGKLLEKSSPKSLAQT
jgi:CBS domain-containing protein